MDGERGISAFDIAGRKLGCFATSIEAASAIMRHARMPAADCTEEGELARAVERFMKGHST